jgi:hypothetical protein
LKLIGQESSLKVGLYKGAFGEHIVQCGESERLTHTHTSVGRANYTAFDQRGDLIENLGDGKANGDDVPSVRWPSPTTCHDIAQGAASFLWSRGVMQIAYGIPKRDIADVSRSLGGRTGGHEAPPRPKESQKPAATISSLT